MVKVSIIVPIYKTELYLATCLKSLINQTLKDIEIILVDDESPDKCPELCDSYAKQDNRIKVIHKKNGGPSSARNKGLEAADGEYIAFCDSDDFVALNTYEICYNMAVAQNADEVRFLHRRFHDHANITTSDNSAAKIYQTSNLIEKLNPILTNMAPLLRQESQIKSDASQCTAIYKTTVIKRHNLKFQSEKELISEDFFFNLDFAAACKKRVFTEYVIYNYRHNFQSVSMSFNPDRYLKNIFFFPNHLAKRLESLNYPNAKVVASGHIFSSLFAFIKHIFNSNLNLDSKKDAYYNLDFNKLKSTYSTYPVQYLSFATRVRFKIVMSQNFWLCYAFEVVKNLLLKFRKE